MRAATRSEGVCRLLLHAFALSMGTPKDRLRGGRAADGGALRASAGWLLCAWAALIPWQASCSGEVEAVSRPSALGPLPLDRTTLEIPDTHASRVPRFVVGDPRFPEGELRAAWIDAREGAARLSWTLWEHGQFAGPRAITSGRSWLVSEVDLPAVASSGDDAFATWVVGHPGGGSGALLRYAVTRDGGATWSAPRCLHDDRSRVEHGYVSVAPYHPVGRPVDASSDSEDGPGSRSGFLALWLDERPGAAADENALPRDSSSAELRARIVAPDGTLGPEGLLDDRVCECCPTALVALEDGALVCAFRDHEEGDLRDVRVARIEVEQGVPRCGTSVLVAHDDWRIAGCPGSGPALAARGDVVVAAWYTEGSGRDAELGARVQLAFSDDGGRSFGPARTVDRGRPVGAPDVALLHDSSAVVAWLEYDVPRGSKLRWLARRVDGTTLGHIVDLGDARPGLSSGLLRCGVGPEGVLALWPAPEGGGLAGALLAEAHAPLQ